MAEKPIMREEYFPGSNKHFLEMLILHFSQLLFSSLLRITFDKYL